jgi:6-phosphofructokinase 1
MKACQTLHQVIQRRKLAIAVCVLLKGINRDIPIFDSCFGFETAVEESSRIIEKAYAFSHSFQNGISLIKLPGYTSGFLASHAVLSTVNSNICLVPEF